MGKKKIAKTTFKTITTSHYASVDEKSPHTAIPLLFFIYFLLIPSCLLKLSLRLPKLISEANSKL